MEDDEQTSLGSPEIFELESSRSKLGVRLILRVSTLSSLKNESVLRTTPLLLLPVSSSPLN